MDKIDNLLEEVKKHERKSSTTDSSQINILRKEMHDLTKKFDKIDVKDPGKEKVLKAVRDKMDKLSNVMFKMANSDSEEKISPRGFKVLK